MLPKSTLGKAISYTLGQWKYLVNYLKCGECELSNNKAERAVNPFVMGRKNFLFCKTPKGARASAVVYSIIETAKANNLKPYQYLEYLFEKLPNMDINSDVELDSLLP